MTVIDLKPVLDSGYFNWKYVKEITDEYGTDSLFTDYGFSSTMGLQKVRAKASELLSDFTLLPKDWFLSG